MPRPSDGRTRADPAPTPRRRRVVKPADARRDDLLLAAVRLFQEQGFHRTTVADIARAADVAPGTVYLYFRSKDEVLLECHRRLRVGIAARIAAPAAAALERAEAGQAVDLATVVGQMVEAAVGYAVENRDLCEVCLKYVPPADPAAGDRLGFLQPLTDVLDRGARLGLIEVTDPLVTAHLLGSALGVTLCGAVVYGAPPLERVLEAAKELVQRTLAQPTARTS